MILLGDIRETLAEDCAQVRHAVETLANRANVLRGTEATAETLEALVVDARRLLHQLNTERDLAKEPLRQAERDVDTYFIELSRRVARIKSTFDGILSDAKPRDDPQAGPPTTEGIES